MMKMTSENNLRLAQLEFLAGLVMGSLDLFPTDLENFEEGLFYMGDIVGGDYDGCAYIAVKPKEEIKTERLDYAKEFVQGYAEWVECGERDEAFVVILRPYDGDGFLYKPKEELDAEEAAKQQ